MTTPPGLEGGSKRARRTDRVTNHEKLIDAAERVFTERGIDAPLDEVARDAGVGIGTLYRHFPHRDDLLIGIYDRAVDAMARILERALQAADAGSGVQLFLRETTAYQADRHIFVEILRRVARENPTYRPGEGLSDDMIRLADRAVAAGYLREGITATDLAVIPMMLSVLGAGPGADQWRERQLQLILTGIRAGGGVVSARALDEDEFDRIVHRVDRPSTPD